MRIVLTNLPAGQGDQVARQLVEERLAACVNRFTVQSTYRWEGEVCDEPEETLFIKVAASQVGPLRDRLAELHPYDVPEIVVLGVDSAASLAAYVDWVREETTP